MLWMFGLRDGCRYLSKTVNPEFYRMFEISTTLPGPSLLTVEVWDHDTLSSDDLIGTTVIDLEDRLFHDVWQRLGTCPEPPPDRFPPKPVEFRSLYLPKRKNEQVWRLLRLQFPWWCSLGCWCGLG